MYADADSYRTIGNLRDGFAMAKQHIVSIDDEGFILKLVETVLKKDYEVSVFQDAVEALEAFQSGLKADLIICDINMPQLDGFGLHEKIRELPDLKRVPFIYLTALNDRQHFRQGMQQGADDYLTKPFTPAELIEAVEIRFNRTSSLRDEKVSLEILSLGGAGATAGGEILHYEAKKVIALLLYLITHEGKVPLRIIPGDLWSEEVGENNIHVLINRARKTFDGYAQFPVLGDILTLKLLESYDWDAEEFEKAAKNAIKVQHSGECEKAIQLYKGIFLPGFDAPWVEQQRSYYDSLYLDLLELSIELAPNETARKSAEGRLQAFLQND